MSEYEYDDYEEEDDYYQDDPPEKLEVSLEIEKLTFIVDTKGCKAIKSLIRDCYPGSFQEYCAKVGIKHPNFYATLKGKGSRPCSLEHLNKILSGIGYSVQLSKLVLVIQADQTGRIVPDVDSITPDIELQSTDLIPLTGDHGSSLLEKHLDNLKIKQESHSSDIQEESSSSTSSSAIETFLTLSPMQLDVDL